MEFSKRNWKHNTYCVSLGSWENLKKLWKHSPIGSCSQSICHSPIIFDRNIVHAHVFYFLNRHIFLWFLSLCRLPHVLGACSVEDVFLQLVEEMHRANTETYLPAFSWKHGAGTQQRCCYTLQANLNIQPCTLGIYVPTGKSTVKEKVCTPSEVAHPLVTDKHFSVSVMII